MERLLTLVAVFACGCTFDAGPRSDAALPPRGYQPTDQGGLYRAIDAPAGAALAAIWEGPDLARRLGSARRWNDVDCDEAHVYLCEWDPER